MHGLVGVQYIAAIATFKALGAGWNPETLSLRKPSSITSSSKSASATGS
jgi:hypothetical protein